ncbi:hypothetical protein AAFF_G00183070 [Aldrovandia affinis]|uniref:Uncharacterized protein n=1 Tax=Aldrovandia affinis TaxID=143900 RepID=A0AAD7W6L9_9TELE|nr:hypothetical protein AAFF_G00183070 [Aldrovandia affinis]
MRPIGQSATSLRVAVAQVGFGGIRGGHENGGAQIPAGRLNGAGHLFRYPENELSQQAGNRDLKVGKVQGIKLSIQRGQGVWGYGDFGCQDRGITRLNFHAAELSL